MSVRHRAGGSEGFHSVAFYYPPLGGMKQLMSPHNSAVHFNWVHCVFAIVCPLPRPAVLSIPEP